MGEPGVNGPVRAAVRTDETTLGRMARGGEVLGPVPPPRSSNAHVVPGYVFSYLGGFCFGGVHSALCAISQLSAQ